MTDILIVDDDDSNREITRLRLESAGYSVREAADGESGISQAQGRPPGLVVLDVMMPKLDGWQVCKILKSDPRTKAIPVVMLTARNQQIEEMRGWESGADDYLTKPCDHRQLIATVGRFLDGDGRTHS